MRDACPPPWPRINGRYKRRGRAQAHSAQRAHCQRSERTLLRRNRRRRSTRRGPRGGGEACLDNVTEVQSSAVILEHMVLLLWEGNPQARAA
ncbi:hypothetical protein MHYP_G00267160 [Metynnis hypsauchen]